MPGLYHNFPDHKRRTTVQLQHSGTLRALQNLRFSDFLGPDRQFLTEMHLKIANGSWCMITNAFFQRRPTNVACDPVFFFLDIYLGIPIYRISDFRKILYMRPKGAEKLDFLGQKWRKSVVFLDMEKC